MRKYKHYEKTCPFTAINTRTAKQITLGFGKEPDRASYHKK